MQFVYCRCQIQTLAFFFFLDFEAWAVLLVLIFLQYRYTLVHLVFCPIPISLLSDTFGPILREKEYILIFYSLVFVAINLVPLGLSHVCSEFQHCGASWKGFHRFHIICCLLTSECLAPVYVGVVNFSSIFSVVTVMLSGRKKAVKKMKWIWQVTRAVTCKSTWRL